MRKNDDIEVMRKILRFVHSSPLLNAILAWVVTLGLMLMSVEKFALRGRTVQPIVWIVVAYGGIFVIASFYAAYRSYPLAERYISRMIRLYLALVLAYANVYFVMLLVLDKPVEGIQAAWTWGIYQDTKTISVRSALLSLVDCIHYSCVTITTLGFGDMHPKHWLAKLVTDSEVLAGLGLVAIGVGRMLSMPPSDRLSVE